MKPSWRSVRRKMGRDALLDPHQIDDRPLMAGGKQTTYGEARVAAEQTRDGNYQTAAKQGLAITLLAVIEDLEGVLYDRTE